MCAAPHQGRSPDPRKSHYAAAPDGAKSPQPGDPNLLDRILNSAPDASRPASQADPEIWKKLLAVAKCYQGQPLAQSPMVVELVRAAVPAAAVRLAGSTETADDMLAQIAESLWNDPPSQERLYSLWAELTHPRHAS